MYFSGWLCRALMDPSRSKTICRGLTWLVTLRGTIIRTTSVVTFDSVLCARGRTSWTGLHSRTATWTRRLVILSIFSAIHVWLYFNQNFCKTGLIVCLTFDWIVFTDYHRAHVSVRLSSANFDGLVNLEKEWRVDLRWRTTWDWTSEIVDSFVAEWMGLRVSCINFQSIKNVSVLFPVCNFVNFWNLDRSFGFFFFDYLIVFVFDW